jgi:hypothetical protein
MPVSDPNNGENRARDEVRRSAKKKSDETILPPVRSPNLEVTNSRTGNLVDIQAMRHITNAEMKILFLHGWISKPGGVKANFLAQHGHDVLNPALPDDDFDAALQIAQAEFDCHGPDVIVGVSRGAAIAMNIAARDTPLVLLCPAWKKWNNITTISPNSAILHSRADEVIPFAHSEELVRNSGISRSALIEVGCDHRLADSDSLTTMLRACERALDFQHHVIERGN